jgi:L-rhamnose isomerase
MPSHTTEIDAEYDAFMARLMRAATEPAARMRARFAKISETMLALYRDPDYRARVKAKRASKD